MDDNSSADISGAVLVSGDQSTGVNASYSNVIIAGGVTAVGKETTAIISEHGDVKVNGGVINVSGAGSTAIKLEDAGLVALDGVSAIADSRGLLMTTETGGALTVASSALSGVITNNNVHSTGMALDITLDGNSALTGTVNDIGNLAVTNLTVADSGSVWHLTGDSRMNGVLENSGTISFAASPRFTTLTVANLASPSSCDTSTFVMKTDIVNQAADRLIVTGAMNGSRHNITVLNQGGANTNGHEVTPLVDTADSNGAFRLTNNIELGGWQYGLRQVNGGLGSVWELYGLNLLTEPAIAPGNTFAANYMLAYAETQTLIQRLGDLRGTPHLAGFWFRGYGGKFEVDSGNFLKSFDMDYWGVQLGYDRKVGIGWNGEFYAGVMFGYSDADLALASGGNGDADSKMLGVYCTFVHPNGFFADLVLKYQWLDNEFNVLDSAGSAVCGNGLSTGGLGVSLELGQRIHFAKEKSTGWYIEPQVQLSYMRQGGGYYSVSNGLRVGAEPFTSILGRLGLLVGYETGNTNFYVKTSKVKEFDGDLTIIANSSPVFESFRSSWWVYGLGFTSRIDEKNSVYLDIERASGGFFEQDWAIKAGWRAFF